MLKSRITDTFVVSTKNPQEKRKIPYDVRLEMIDNETVLNDSGLLEKHHR